MLQYLAKKARLSIAWCGSGVWKERHHGGKLCGGRAKAGGRSRAGGIRQRRVAGAGARIIDRSGGRRLPIGYDGWADAMGGSAMASADNEMMEQMFALLELGGTVLEPLDLSVVFPDAGVRVDAVWPSAASAWP